MQNAARSLKNRLRMHMEAMPGTKHQIKFLRSAPNHHFIYLDTLHFFNFFPKTFPTQEASSNGIVQIVPQAVPNFTAQMVVMTPTLHAKSVIYFFPILQSHFDDRVPLVKGFV
jgi:hypothetical protein